MSLDVPVDKWYRFVSGDHSCFQDLFKGYYHSLYGYGLKLCNDPELVEDHLQNLFVSVWEKRNELKHVVSPNVYLFVSLRRNILKSRKRANREKEIIREENDDFIINFETDDIIIKRESVKQQQKELQKALNHLSNQQKEVLFLHFYNGMSYGEIEEILSINRQSVRNHMYRAMQTLRSVLDIDILRLVITLAVTAVLSLHFFA